MSKQNPSAGAAAPNWLRLAIASYLLLTLVTSAGCSLVAHGQNVEGVRLHQQGNYQAALVNFQQALASNPNSADAYYNLGATYHRLGKLYQRETDFDQAEGYYNQSLDHDPEHREAYRGLAVLLVEQGRSEEGFRLVEGWVDRSPSAAIPKIELARLFEEFGDRDAAKEHLVDALSVEPNNTQALAALGKIHEELGNYPQALADYQRSLAHDRFQPEVAARVVALQSALGPHPADLPGGTRIVNVPFPVIRR